MALITAHTELEHVTLERELGQFKRTTDQRWCELVYDGLWFSPLKTALEAFVANTQESVTGEIRLVLHGGHIAVNGRRSSQSLYDFNLATYDEGDTFDQSSAKGSSTYTACRRRSPPSGTATDDPGSPARADASVGFHGVSRVVCVCSRRGRKVK